MRPADTTRVVHTMAIEPVPSDEEAAAIAVAITTAWTSTPVASTWVGDDARDRWRFSGRWWSKPVPSRRSRP